MFVLSRFFHFHPLAAIIMTSIGIIGLTAIIFSRRYLAGDSRFKRFVLLVTGLVASLCAMVASNHVVLFLSTWAMANGFLVGLMIHNANWRAAYQSGLIAAKYLSFGLLMLSAAVLLLAVNAQQYSIQGIIQAQYDPFVLSLALILLLIAALVQSAIWPFHGWLLSSLNSPTPVSAIMHAGLINGGGVLLAKFAPLYIAVPTTLNLIFIIGLASAVLGTLWKLMQTDIKRMLACSTLAQMGFMFVQCGLGLFSAAIAHLFLHGLFKAYLFFSSGNAARDKKVADISAPKAVSLMLAMLCGAVGALIFAHTSNKSLFALDTQLFLILIAFIAGTQFSLSFLKKISALNLSLALAAASFAGGLYGYNVFWIEWFCRPMNIMSPQPLNMIHIFGLILLATSWLLMLYPNNALFSMLKNRMYVRMLNASQPHPKTVTAHRNNYQYN